MNDFIDIKTRLEAITPGEWRVVLDDRWKLINPDEERYSVVHDMSTTLDLGAVALIFLGGPDGYRYTKENAEFVANAPADMRTLLNIYKTNEKLLQQFIEDGYLGPGWRQYLYESDIFVCGYCGEMVHDYDQCNHTLDCPVKKAQHILSGDT